MLSQSAKSFLGRTRLTTSTTTRLRRTVAIKRRYDLVATVTTNTTAAVASSSSSSAEEASEATCSRQLQNGIGRHPGAVSSRRAPSALTHGASRATASANSPSFEKTLEEGSKSDAVSASASGTAAPPEQEQEQGKERVQPSTGAASSAASGASAPYANADRTTRDLPLVKITEKRLHVGWTPLSWSKFNYFWLRDHCRCPKCFHGVTKQRLVNTFDIPPDIQPSSAEATVNGLKVSWPGHSSKNPHISFYPWTWLKWNAHEPVVLEPHEVPLLQERDKVLWGAKIVQDPPTVEHASIMDDDRGVWKLLQKIDTFGFCFVSGVEASPEATERLAKGICRIRETQYGGFWDFTSDLAKGDTAYTTLALSAHTDTTYFTDPCGLQLFHLLSHTGGRGGESLLVDGFYAASLLKELHPDAYTALATVRVPTHAAGEPGELFRPNPPSGYPILNLDPYTGKLRQVRYNNDDRSVMRGRDIEEMERWYEALRLWNSTLKSPDSEYWVQLTPGTVVVIDNHRVLHGRSAFDGKRRMCGAYIGMDDFRSKLTVLTEKYGGRSIVDEDDVSGEATRDNWSPLF